MPDRWTQGRSAIVSDGTLIYLCYGRQDIFEQTVFSILSLCHHCGPELSGISVVVYTDRPARFDPLPVETVTLSETQLSSWLGDSDYIHRRKTCVILDALSRYGRKVAFVDSDTYFKTHPARIWSRVGPGRACFHIAEGFLRSTRTPFDEELARQLAQDGLDLHPAQPVQISHQTIMWNTGVVAVDPTDRHRLDEALLLSDAIWRTANPKGPFGQKIHHAEQFATGYAFRDCQLSEADDSVYHYWRSEAKRSFGAILPTLAESGLSDLSPANLARIYAERYREWGVASLIDTAKMVVRKVALTLGIAVGGVRRSVR